MSTVNKKTKYPDETAGIEYPRETMDYIANMGRFNAALADMADCVIEAVYGIPLVIKGKEKLPCIF